MNLRIRCNNCNLQEYTIIKNQPESNGLIPKLFRLKNRNYVINNFSSEKIGEIYLNLLNEICLRK